MLRISLHGLEVEKFIALSAGLERLTCLSADDPHGTCFFSGVLRVNGDKNYVDLFSKRIKKSDVADTVRRLELASGQDVDKDDLGEGY